MVHIGVVVDLAAIGAEVPVAVREAAAAHAAAHAPLAGDGAHVVSRARHVAGAAVLGVTRDVHLAAVVAQVVVAVGEAGAAGTGARAVGAGVGGLVGAGAGEAAAAAVGRAVGGVHLASVGAQVVVAVGEASEARA